jgi:hypothetical protein
MSLKHRLNAIYMQESHAVNEPAPRNEAWKYMIGGANVARGSTHQRTDIKLSNRFECLYNSSELNNDANISVHNGSNNNNAHNFRDYRSFKLNYISGDLFELCTNGSIVHCAGADFLMEKGFAVSTKERNGNVTQLRSLKKRTGEVAAQPIGESSRFLFHLVTKKYTRGKPHFEDLMRLFELILRHIALKELCFELGVKCLNMPKIASGLDQIP